MNTWRNSPVCQTLGLQHPIIQGPFGGGLSSIELTAAVSNAGGLGSFGAHHLSGQQIIDTAAAMRQETSKPFALNLWLPFAGSDSLKVDARQYDHQLNHVAPYFKELATPLPQQPPAKFAPSFNEQIDALFQAKPAVFSFVYGVPEAWILQRCRELGIVTLGAATTVDEAKALENAGVDMIVASGFEAGGHRVSFLRPAEEVLTGGIALIPQMVDAVTIPVIAAGGISDGRGIAAALMLGANAVQIGTAFLACKESGATDLHRNILFSEAARDTQLTKVFSGRLARGIRNRLVDEGRKQPTLPYPAQNWLMGQLKQAAIQKGQADLMSLWSGQSAPLLQHHEVTSLMASLVKETTEVLSQYR
jgi:nitronate monooxygenase